MKENPSLKAAIERVVAWLDAHAHLPYVDTRRIVRDVRDVPAIELLAALGVLASARVVRPAFKVVAPTNHVFTDGIYQSVDEIPETLTDTSETAFPKEEGDVQAVYERVGAGADE